MKKNVKVEGNKIMYTNLFSNGIRYFEENALLQQIDFIHIKDNAKDTHSQKVIF